MRSIQYIVGAAALAAFVLGSARTERTKGAVAGQRCPTFTYKTIDGKSISDKSLRGKAFVIDVYSPS
jgi:hypothetical protein